MLKRREDLLADPYWEEIKGSQPFPAKRERELAERIQQGDLEARNELVGANLRFVVSVAKQYQHRGLPLCDLVSGGNMGLMIATRASAAITKINSMYKEPNSDCARCSCQKDFITNSVECEAIIYAFRMATRQQVCVPPVQALQAETHPWSRL